MTVQLKSLKGLAEKLAIVRATELPQASTRGAREVGELALTIAQKRLIGRGTPLEKVGEFGPWAPLKDSTIGQKSKKGLGLGGNPASILYATGELQRSVRLNVRRNMATIGSDIPYAAVHEYGAPSKNIPPRPVFGPAMILAASEMRRHLRKLLTASIAGRNTI